MLDNTENRRQAPAGLTSFMLPIRKFLDQPNVIEICINRPKQLFVETYDGWKEHDVPELTYSHLDSLASTIATHTKQRLGVVTPILSGALPEGERIQIVIPPAVPQGTISITIRKPSTQHFSLENYAEAGFFDNVETEVATLSSTDKALLELHKTGRWVEFLKAAVIAKKNILVSGPTGSGKTTFAKSLIPIIPSVERLITIEDTIELRIPQPNHVRLVYSKDGQGQAQVSARQLLESSLRMRPDRVLLQELRDATAFYYLRNVNTGHGGSITTIHANSAMLAFEQLVLLVKESEAGRDLSRTEIKAMLFQMVDVVLQIERVDGRFKCKELDFNPLRKIQGQRE